VQKPLIQQVVLELLAELPLAALAVECDQQSARSPPPRTFATAARTFVTDRERSSTTRERSSTTCERSSPTRERSSTTRERSSSFANVLQRPGRPRALARAHFAVAGRPNADDEGFSRLPNDFARLTGVRDPSTDARDPSMGVRNPLTNARTR
jgi:hypothetical protein